MLVTTFKTILNAFNSSSKDETRPQLTTVKLEKTELQNKVNIVSCDGYSLFKETVFDEDLFNKLPENGILIYTENKNKIKDIVKYHKNNPSRDVEVSINENFLEVLCPSVKTSLRLCTREFPKYQSILPKDYEHIELCFNLEFLNNLVKSFDQQTRNSKNVRLLVRKDDSLAPMIVKPYQADGREIEAVLMPLKP